MPLRNKQKILRLLSLVRMAEQAPVVNPGIVPVNKTTKRAKKQLKILDEATTVFSKDQDYQPPQKESEPQTIAQQPHQQVTQMYEPVQQRVCELASGLNEEQLGYAIMIGLSVAGALAGFYLARWWYQSGGVDEAPAVVAFMNRHGYDGEAFLNGLGTVNPAASAVSAVTNINPSV